MKQLTNQPISNSAGMLFIVDGLADIGTNNIKGIISVIVGLIFIVFVKENKNTNNNATSN